MDIIRAIWPWFEIILAVALAATILLQRNEAGLGTVFGGDAGVVHTKRGLEKGLFITTIILAVLFIGSSIVALLLPTV